MPSRHSLMNLMYNLRVLTKQPANISNLKIVNHVLKSYNGNDWYRVYTGAYKDRKTNQALANTLYMNAESELHNSHSREKIEYNTLSSIEKGKIHYDMIQCRMSIETLLNSSLYLPREQDYWTHIIDNTAFYQLKLIYLKSGEETPMHNHKGVCISSLLGDANEHWGMVRELRWTGEKRAKCKKHIYSLKDKETHFNVIYPNTFHQVKACGGDVVMLNLYFNVYIN